MAVLLEEALLNYLQSRPAIQGATQGRVYAIEMPQRCAMPAITFADVSTVPVNSVDGASTLRGSRIQVECWGNGYEQAKQLARSVREALDGFVGEWSGLGVAVEFLGQRDSRWRKGKLALYRVTAEFRVWHSG